MTSINTRNLHADSIRRLFIHVLFPWGYNLHTHHRDDLTSLVLGINENIENAMKTYIFFVFPYLKKKLKILK